MCWAAILGMLIVVFYVSVDSNKVLNTSNNKHTRVAVVP